MQKWLPLNYSFVHIQNSLTNLVRDNKFFAICLKNEVSEANLKYEQKNNIKAAIFSLGQLDWLLISNYWMRLSRIWRLRLFTKAKGRGE